MPTKKPQLIDGEIYHVVIRGIDGRNIFNDQKDYYRAIHDLFEFNDVKPAGWRHRHSQLYENRSRRVEKKQLVRDFIVHILVFCLMPNHVHLLLQQVQDGGISKFMRKFGAGYAGYFNRRHERRGYLFQGRFRVVHVKTNTQLKTAFVYIHTNPVALIDPRWKEGGIKQHKKAIKFIENYKWSSYADYINKENFPSVTQRDFLEKMMKKEEWRRCVNEWVKYKTMKGWDGGIELE